MAAPSSAIVNAPKSESAPPTIQTRKTSPAEPVARAIALGTRNTPVPIMWPTTMAIAAAGPSPRTSSSRFSLIALLKRRPYAGTLSSSLLARLTAHPVANVTLAPIRTYHVKATLVNPNTHKIATNPANMPTSAPRALARRSSVPSRNSPSKLPKGSDATVNPASSSGPHFTSPNLAHEKQRQNAIRAFAGDEQRRVLREHIEEHAD